jgi:hypothetical protein
MPKVRGDGIKGQKAWVFFKRVLHFAGFVALMAVNGFENKRDQTVGRKRAGLYEMTYIVFGVGVALCGLAALFRNATARCFRCCGISTNAG